MMEFEVEARSKKCQKLLTSIMPSMIKQLGLENSKKAVLILVTDDVGPGMHGATLYIEIADCYLVLLKKPARLTATALIEISTTLAHEMVHVRQLAKGIMKFAPRQSRIWMGKLYTKKTKYLDQPWELDAFARQEIIVRRAIE
jgi:hypothetical protein